MLLKRKMSCDNVWVYEIKFGPKTARNPAL